MNIRRIVIIVFFHYIHFIWLRFKVWLCRIQFQLSEDSRLPRWFISQDYSRKDLKITITFYTHPIFKNKVKIVIYGPLQNVRH